MKFKCPYCNMNNDLMYSLTGINIKHIEIQGECYYCQHELIINIEFIKKEPKTKIEKIKPKDYIG